MSLPKFNELPESKMKDLIAINDMMKAGYTLTNIKNQASLKGFDSIAKVRGFKAAATQIMIELKNNGLIIT